MGMYDTVIVKDKLPWTDEMWEEGLPNACTEFQTKGLSDILANYKIENGRLLLQKFKDVKLVDSEMCNGWGSTLQRTGEYWEDTNYHGELSFYDYIPNDVPGNNDCWIEFTAKFTSGQVDKIEVAGFEKTSNTTRLETIKTIAEEIYRNRNRWSNKYFNHTAPVRWFRLRVWNEFWYRASQFCDKMRLLW